MGRTSVYVQNNIEMPEMHPGDAANLYGKLKDKAEEDITSALIERAGAYNEIKLVHFETVRTPADLGQKAYIAFTVNGKMYKIDASVDWRDAMNRSILSAVFEQALEQMNAYEARRLLEKA